MTNAIQIAEDKALLEAVEKADDALLDYFHLLEHPFRGGPNYRFLYTTEQVNEAISRCIQMTVKRTHPIYMYGAYGTGKSTIIRRLYSLLSLDPRFEVRFVILHNRVTANSLVRNILEEFGIKTARSFDQSLRNLQNHLHELNEAQKIPTLLIDEAQYMNRDTLKLIHYLLNFETNKTKLLQIVLVGQEELGTKIIQYRELASRMFPIAMNAMSPDDLKDMINFRLNVAGYRGEIFEDADEAYKKLYTYTKGLPRDAIKICFELFIELASQGMKKGNSKHIEEIAKGQNLRI